MSSAAEHLIPNAFRALVALAAYADHDARRNAGLLEEHSIRPSPVPPAFAAKSLRPATAAVLRQALPIPASASKTASTTEAFARRTATAVNQTAAVAMAAMTATAMAETTTGMEMMTATTGATTTGNHNPETGTGIQRTREFPARSMSTRPMSRARSESSRLGPGGYSARTESWT